MSVVEVRVPDLGDAKGVSVLDVLVKKGDKVAVEDPLLTLESDKAAMDVPSPVKGVINSIAIKKGDTVSSGMLIGTVESEEAAAPASVPPANAAARLHPRLRRPEPQLLRLQPHLLSAPARALQSARHRPERWMSSCWVPVSAAIRRHFARRTWVST
jgi:pyruvate/2-oxoglutarate dehydrogenase complex dihydrolipoamide acyltransferase (E2) component